MCSPTSKKSAFPFYSALFGYLRTASSPLLSLPPQVLPPVSTSGSQTTKLALRDNIRVHSRVYPLSSSPVYHIKMSGTNDNLIEAMYLFTRHRPVSNKYSSTMRCSCPGNRVWGPSGHCPSCVLETTTPVQRLEERWTLTRRSLDQKVLRNVTGCLSMINMALSMVFPVL